ncbi:MAG: hypothetical protein M3340_05670 [Actinomycetota bacterium]|nr:hypothetical protein [Actinomycetota bacterium]
MRARVALALVAAGLLAPPAASAQTGASGWDGVNPFDCTLQQAGTEAEFPQPDADPFCVEYDKRHQNVSQLGVVEFLSLEPARVAAASPKCFYFQHDHWVGYVDQGNPATQTYAWDGSYYFDKARGTGGVYVENFSFNGQTGDPSQLPGFPAEYKPFFGPGKGGVQRSEAVEADPRCVEQAKQRSPYRSDGPGGASGSQGSDRCRSAGGRVDRGIGGVRLGMKRGSARQKLGRPTTESSKYMTWCMTGGGRVVAAFGTRGDGARAVLVATDAQPFDARGFRPGSRSWKARRGLRGERAIARNVLAESRRKDVLIAGLASGRVSYVASASRAIGDKRAARFLARMPRP